MTLENTRERALPWHAAQTLDDYLVYLKHVALYDFAAAFVAQKRVLDLGCGEGYGARAHAQNARMVVAADYDADAVAHAARVYAAPNLAFVVCDAQRLPFVRRAFDAATSFEVIEHVPDARAYADELARVTASVTLISTPNRAMRLLPFQKPWNRFHLREYAAHELARVLRRAFARVTVRGVTARADILARERARVKQNPFVAYPRMLAQMVLPRAVYARAKQLQPAEPAAREAFDATHYTARDFAVMSHDGAASITLVAVCQRNPDF